MRSKLRIATIAIAAALMATAAAPELLDEYAPSEALSQSKPATPNPSGQAATALTRLPVKGPAPMTGYDRTEKFGPAWSDDVGVTGGHNGCDARNDIYKVALEKVTIEPGTDGCVVESGTLMKDPYSGKRIYYDGGGEELQMEHIVALGDAWKTGAQQLSAQQRRNLANDPLNLTPVDASLNQAKKDADIASWQPPNKPFRCTYAATQIAVKTKYHLWVTAAEADTMARVLETCPGQKLPTSSHSGGDQS